MTIEYCNSVCNVRDYGARGDGSTLETAAIQRAIDACAVAGGTVLLPPGRYLSGTLFMRSDVTLHISKGAILLGSTTIRDFPPIRPALRSYADNYSDKSLIYGENLERIAITGEGIIDGQGGLYERKISPLNLRPMILRFITCRGVCVENVTLQNSPMFLQWYLGCEQLRIRGVRGFNHCNYQNDFLDIDGCSEVIVQDCVGDSDDDGITLKSSSDRLCQNIAISNCVISTMCSALKFGTESNGGFRNIAVSNLVISRSEQDDFRQKHKPGLAGIALACVDGGQLDGVTVSNVAMRGCYTPLFLRLGNRGRPYMQDMPKLPVGSFRNVNINNILAVGAEEFASSITGIPGHPIENVSLSNINITCRGGGSGQDCTIDVPEKIERYPDCHKFGNLPAYGFFCRHVHGLTFDNVRVSTELPDGRHGFYGEDLEDFSFERVSFPGGSNAAPPIKLKDARHALVRGCAVQAPVDTFMKVEGTKSNHIVVSGNNVRKVGKIVETTREVPRSAISHWPNEKPQKKKSISL